MLRAIEQGRDDQKTIEGRTLRAIEQSKSEILLVVENTVLKLRLASCSPVLKLVSSSKAIRKFATTSSVARFFS